MTSTTRNTHAPADPSETTGAGDEGVESSEPMSPGQRGEYLAVLSGAIVAALIGFEIRLFWIIAVLLLVVLWGCMASELRAARGERRTVAGALATVASETKHLAHALAGDALPGDDSNSAARSSGGSTAATEADEPTKKELYEAAKDREIEGRSHMSKDELKEALDSE